MTAEPAGRGLSRRSGEKGGEVGALGQGEAADEADGVVEGFFFLHVADGMEAGDDVVTGVGDEELGGAEGVANLLQAVCFELG